MADMTELRWPLAVYILVIVFLQHVVNNQSAVTRPESMDVIWPSEQRVRCYPRRGGGRSIRQHNKTLLLFCQ